MQTYADYAPTGFDTQGAFLPAQQTWLVVPVGQNRDSDLLSQSNFDQTLKMLGGESDTVEVHRFGHWACGWCEIIIVQPDTDAAAIAEEIENSLADYPVLSESDYSAREYASYTEQWSSWGCREFRSELVRKFDLDEDTEDALDDVSESDCQEFFESLNECGDYYNDGEPHLGRSISRCTREDLDEWLSKMAENSASASKPA